MFVPPHHRARHRSRYGALSFGVVLLLSTVQSFAQEQPLTISTEQGTEKQKDTSSVRRDTVPLPKAPSPMVFTTAHDTGTFVFRAPQVEWHDQRYVGDLLTALPGFIMRDQGGVGQYNQAVVRGIDWRGISISADGRSLNDPATGIYNLFFYPCEQAELFEVLTGSSSFIHGYNGAGAVIRLESKDFVDIIPFSKVRYAESAYGYQFSDGTISQNITRNTNISLGFQQQSTDGRFDNSYYTSWNIRGKFRWSLTPRLHLSISERYTSNETGLNGGVDIFKTFTGYTFDPRLAVVVNPDSYERNDRHDLDLSFVAQLFDDSTALSSIHAYLSHSLREYRDEENRDTPNGVYVESDLRTDWMGVTANQIVKLPFQTLTLGGNVEANRIDIGPDRTVTRTTKLAVWGQDEVQLPLDIRAGVFGRYDAWASRSALGYGINVSARLGEFLTVFAGASHHHRLPTYMEADRIDTIITRTSSIEAEQHQLMEIGGVIHPWENSIIRLAYVRRSVEDPITILPYGSGRGFPGVLITNGTPITIEGIELSAKLHFGPVYGEGTVLHLIRRHDDGTMMSDQPKLTAQGGIYFWDTLLEKKLSLKAGFRGIYSSASTGPIFQPELLMYADGAYDIGAGSRVDFVGIARIGDAYIHFVWENLTNTKYYGTPFYPVQDRSIRFGVSWEFLN